jgi:urease accessory protein UreF
MTHTRENEEVPVVRQVSLSVAATVTAAIILAIIGNALLMRDSLRDNTAAAAENAKATNELREAVREFGARFAAKDMKDGQQDYRLDDYERRISRLENQKPLRLQ